MKNRAILKVFPCNYSIFLLILLLAILVYCISGFIDVGNIKGLAHAEEINFTNLDKYPSTGGRLDTSSKISDFTLMVYIVGSDLEDSSHAASHDIQEMLNANIDPNINLILQTGGSKEKSDNIRKIDFSINKRYQISNHGLHLIQNASLGKLNMGEKKTLMDFIRWGLEKFPAKKYGIIFWDHGNPITGFGSDVNFNKDFLDLNELSGAFSSSQFYLSNGQKIERERFEFIGFDSCLMASIDVASKLSSFARYFIASEEIEPTWGWDYTTLLNSLSSNTTISGGSLGKIIVDSYQKNTKEIAQTKRFGADRDVTLSVIDLDRIQEVIDSMSHLLEVFTHQEKFDSLSAIKFLKSIHISEHYGQTAYQSLGILDIYDFTLNLEKAFPNLHQETAAVREAINHAVINRFSGESKPNSYGLSLFLPSTPYELTSIRPSIVQDEIYNIAVSKVLADSIGPKVSSNQNNTDVVIRVFGNDISNAYEEIIINSSKGNHVKYLQNINQYNFSKNGIMHYNSTKILSLCNESTCQPVSVKYQYTRDKVFAYIPILLQSVNDSKHEISLIYELKNNDEFLFLGGIDKFDSTEPVPKLKINLETGYRIYPKGLIPDTSHQSDSNNDYFLKEIATSGVYSNSLQVFDPQRIKPKFTNPQVGLISFVFCDYAEHCNFTRWYNMQKLNNNETDQISKVNHPQSSASQYVLKVKTGNDTATSYLNNKYINSQYKFEFRYPKDWTILAEDIKDDDLFYNDSRAYDPNLVQLFPLKQKIVKPYSNWLPTTFSVNVDDLVLERNNFCAYMKLVIEREHAKSIASPVCHNFSNYSSMEHLVNSEEDPKTSPEIVHIEKLFGKDRIILDNIQPTAFTVYKQYIFLNNKLYTLIFRCTEPVFAKYSPLVKQMIGTFRFYDQIKTIPDSEGNLIKSSNINDEYKNKLTNDQNMTKNIFFKGYYNGKYGYEIKYPYYNEFGPRFHLLNYSANEIKLLFPWTSSPSFEIPSYVTICSFKLDEPDKLAYDCPLGQLGGKYLKEEGARGLHGFVRYLSNVLFSTKPSIKFLESIQNPSTTFIEDEEYKSFLGYPALYTEVSYFENKFGTNVHEKYIFTIIDNAIFIFVYTSTLGNYYKDYHFFNDLINSFHYSNEPTNGTFPHIPKLSNISNYIYIFWQDPPFLSYSNDSGSTLTAPTRMTNVSSEAPVPPVLYSNGEQLFTAGGKNRVTFDTSTYDTYPSHRYRNSYSNIELSGSGSNVYLISKKPKGSDPVTVQDSFFSLSKYDIMLSYANGSNTFSPPKTIREGIRSYSGNAPPIASDGKNFYMLIEDPDYRKYYHDDKEYRQANSSLSILYSNNAGKTFNDPKKITNEYRTNEFQSDFSTVLASENNVYVVWMRPFSYDPKPFIKISYSNDGGRTFSGPIKLADYSLNEMRILGKGNNVYVIGTMNSSIHILYSKDGGKTFNGSKILGTVKPSEKGIYVKDPPIVNLNPSISVVGNSVYVVWETGGNIIYTYSNDGGNTFSTPLDISKKTGSSLNPSIAATGNSVYVVWKDLIQSNIMLVLSNDNGSTFTEPRIIGTSNQKGAIPLIVSGIQNR